MKNLTQSHVQALYSKIWKGPGRILCFDGFWNMRFRMPSVSKKPRGIISDWLIFAARCCDDISLKLSNLSAGASAGHPGTTSRTSRAGSSSTSSRSGGRSMTPPGRARRQSTKTLPAWWGRPPCPSACSPRALIRLPSPGCVQRGETDAAAAPPWLDGHRMLCTVVAGAHLVKCAVPAGKYCVNSLVGPRWSIAAVCHGRGESAT